jgi:hypothetical protein
MKMLARLDSGSARLMGGLELSQWQRQHSATLLRTLTSTSTTVHLFHHVHPMQTLPPKYTTKRKHDGSVQDNVQDNLDGNLPAKTRRTAVNPVQVPNKITTSGRSSQANIKLN